MKNKFTDLNGHLFAQLERLSDEDMTDEQLLTEVTRAQAMVKVSDRIVSAAGLQLKAAEFVAKNGGRHKAPANLLEAPPATIENKTVETKAAEPADRHPTRSANPKVHNGERVVG